MAEVLRTVNGNIHKLYCSGDQNYFRDMLLYSRESGNTRKQMRVFCPFGLLHARMDTEEETSACCVLN
jgi:hypothetical protein